MTPQDTMRLALEALELHAKQYPHMQKGYTVDAIEALKAALAQQGEQQTNWNRKIRDSVDSLLAQAGYAEDSSARHQLACMNFDAAAPIAQLCKVCEEVHAILDTDESMIIRDAKDGYPEGRASRTLTLQERVKALCVYAADWKRWHEETQAAPAAQPIPLAATCHCACVVQEGQVTELCKMHSKLVSPAAQPTCKQDLPVETEQERYVRMCPDIECGRKKRCTRMVGVSCMSRADIAPAAQPDWSLLEATQESLREHMAMVKELQDKLAQQGEQHIDALCDRICAAIKAADDKCMDEAGYMLDSNDCIRIVREHLAGAAPAAQPDARKVIEELLYCVKAWERGCLHEDYRRDRDDAIQAGQEWLEENK